jgi:hypothetical protein
MVRSILMAMLMIGSAPMAQAMAQAKTTCNEEIATVSKMIDAATDATKKQAAMQDIEKAKAAMEKYDESGCMAYTQSARKKLYAD